MRERLLRMLQEDHDNSPANDICWQEELAQDSQRIAKAGSFRLALIQYLFTPPPLPRPSPPFFLIP